MKIYEIYAYLDSISPFKLQEKWDNSGLIIGNMNDDFHKVYISLDIDLDSIMMMENDTLVITHHPLIFGGIKKIHFDDYTTKLLQMLIKKNIKLISMHTNVDKTHLNKYVMENVLGFKISRTEEFILEANVNMDFSEFVELVQSKLNLKQTKVVKSKDFVKSFTLTTGSGMSLLPYIQTDCFLTGDVKYHDAIDAKMRGINIIDIGHYESEIFFGPMMKEVLEEYLKINEINAIIPTFTNPFIYTSTITGEEIE